MQLYLLLINNIFVFGISLLRCGKEFEGVAQQVFVYFRSTYFSK